MVFMSIIFINTDQKLICPIQFQSSIEYVDTSDDTL
jgi:hypothetical protein